MVLYTFRQTDSYPEDACSTFTCRAPSASIYWVVDGKPLLAGLPMRQSMTGQRLPNWMRVSGSVSYLRGRTRPSNELFFYNCPVNTGVSKASYKVILFTLCNRNHNVCILGPDWFVFFSVPVIVNLWLDKVLAEGRRCQNGILHRVWSHYCPLVPCNLPHDWVMYMNIIIVCPLAIPVGKLAQLEIVLLCLCLLLTDVIVWIHCSYESKGSREGVGLLIVAFRTTAFQS